MTLYLGSDHAGFEVKERMKRWLLAKGHRVVDVGARRRVPRDDYPEYALAVSQAVAKGKGRGILLCGNGVGMCMVANKVRGVRAALVWSKKAACTARTDDDTNVLCLPGRLPTLDSVESIVKVWITTRFSGAVRHKRRLKKVAAI